VVGALTAGIGLIPYMAVVGIVAAGGGAVFFQSYSRPQGSRLIIAADTMDEAIKWKAAIEEEISKLDRSRKPMLPSCADPLVISSIIDSGRGASWRCIMIKEGMRFLEQTQPSPNTLCRKAQLTVNCIPVSVFIAVMEGQHWPRRGKIKVEKVLDDHADVVSVSLTTTYTPKDKKNGNILSTIFPKTKTSTRSFSLTRFWKLDDDGIYLVTLNTFKAHDSSDEHPIATSVATGDLGLNIVITIAPRKDHAEFNDELPSALVTCVVQVSNISTYWLAGEVDQFVNDLLYQQLLDLRQSILFARYGFCSELSFIPVPSSSSSSSSAAEKKESTQPMPTLKRGVSSPIDFQEYYRHGDKGNGSTNRSAAITTQQPGLEDASLSSYNHNTAINTIQEYGSPLKPMSNGSASAAAGPVPLARQRSMGIFRRKHDPPSTTATSSSSTEPSAKAVAAQASRSAKRYSRFSSHRKSINANPEAAFLRQQIAGKEYELDRIEKMVSKKMPTHAQGSAMVTIASQQRLIMELKDLKAQYLTMTGTAYEATVRKRGLFSRVRVFQRSQSPSRVPTPTAAAATTAESSAGTPWASKASFESSSAAVSTSLSASPSVHPTMTMSPLAKSIPSHWRKSAR
jgi:hypothetical protein